MKHPYKIYLETESYNKLVSKAKEAGLDGKGCLSRYIEKIANEPICFLDQNVKSLLKAIKP